MTPFIANKIAFCVRLAREASRYSWQQPTRHQVEYLRIRKESIQDARRWMAESKI